MRVERAEAALLAKPQVGEGARVVLDPGQFTSTALEKTRRRGGPAAPPFAVSGRNRIDVRFGMRRTSGSSAPAGAVVAGSRTSTSSAPCSTPASCARTWRSPWAPACFPATAAPRSATQGVFAGDSTIVAVPLGVRWNPTRGDLQARPVKPYLALSLGPVIGSGNGASVSPQGVFAGDRTEVTVGGQVGVGVDFHLNRRFSLGLCAGYDWMADFPDPIGGRDNYSGFTARRELRMAVWRGLRFSSLTRQRGGFDATGTVSRGNERRPGPSVRL